MRVIETSIADVKILEPEVFLDSRGFFIETWNENRFLSLGLNVTFVQDNHSRSIKGTLRGLHYQVKRSQGKLVRVLNGEVYDVVVDLRKSSPTFGQHVGVILNDENKRMFWVPPGFAHGFVVLSESADFLYKCTDFYAPQFERSLLWNDPALGIDWQLNSKVGGAIKPSLSAKDEAGLPLAQCEVFQ
jgi:dTDP-4-dehydrorhamnose 3,5-epimerase